MPFFVVRKMKKDRKLILEDGSEYYGTGFGSGKDAVCEVVFNTSMAGYQEILSDPSYTDQAVVMSYPLIGNYGIADEDFESKRLAPSALIVRDLCENPSNFRSTRSVDELLEENGIPGISNVDTRRLVRSIREYGSGRGLITGAGMAAADALEIIRRTPVPHDAVRRCSCLKKWYSRTSNPCFTVVVIDCGMKTNIIRMLNHSRCNVTVVPYDTGYEEILALSPDGVLISNGPGDPQDVPEVVHTLRMIIGKCPVFGICLGHQLIALACGGSTYKLPFGHRGGNHPVRDVRTGRIFITSQNHSYTVDEESLAGTGLMVSYVNLLDQTIEGLYSEKDAVISVQFHPESAPGPQDTMQLFDCFTDMMRMKRNIQA